MLGQTCRFDKAQHGLVHCELEDWIKRQVPAGERDLLFIYRHHLHGTFVIGYWVVLGSLFMDVMNLGHSLANFSRAMAQKFKRQFGDSMSREDMIKELKQHERDRLSGLQQENDEEVERRGWYHKQGIKNLFVS